ncbi:MAG: UDP-glucose 4-epimerase GalE [Oscillospiraceae bacterium]|nr:UDP-glucose 4-epimerase GalE [Oscillospiraceae bacterium]
MAILVTGGAGYIGSHTCVELLNAGYEIVVLDNFSNSEPDVIRRIKELTGKDFPVAAVNLLHAPDVSRVFAENEIEAVIHFAGLKAVGESVAKPLEYYHNNVTGTLTLLGAMREFGCKRIVFSSSATVYGADNKAPFKETDPLPAAASNPYGTTKLVIENILRDLCVSEEGWSAVLLRYFNPVGAHKSGLLGERPKGVPNNLVPFISQVAAGRREYLNIFGSDYDTPDGTCIRDYLHVVDLAKGHLKALEYKGAGAEAINLGTGRGYSVLEVLAAYEKACGRKLPSRQAERRPGDIAESCADASKALKLLGWRAELGLDEMCADAWNYEKNNI